MLVVYMMLSHYFHIIINVILSCEKYFKKFIFFFLSLVPTVASNDASLVTRSRIAVIEYLDSLSKPTKPPSTFVVES